MLENLIDKHLKKQGFIRVPITWTEDYKSLMDKKLKGDALIREIGREYNILLEDFTKTKTQKWLKEQLEDIKINTNNLSTKEDLINEYLNAFKINFEDDFEEEIK